jgi:hypothetical protein
MSKSEDQQLNRRDFLRGGAILFGGVAAGILPKIAEAQVARPTKPVSGVNVAARLMFWNGTAFVPASELPAGDASLSAIALRLRANSNDGGLKGLDVVFSSATKEPFLAWTSPSRGGTTSGAFTAPVSNGTLSVVAITTGTTRVAEDGTPLDTRTTINLMTGGGRGDKLMEGTYLLVTGSASISGVRYTPEDATNPIVAADGSPVRFQYLMIQISREA